MKKMKRFCVLGLISVLLTSCSVSNAPKEDEKTDDKVYHTVVWFNYDQTLLYKDTKVEDGTVPIYRGATPTRQKTQEHSYTFSGWSPEVVPAYIDTNYIAQFRSELNKYSVTWKDSDGTTLQIESYEYGSMPSYSNALPNKEEEGYCYSFDHWTPEVKIVTEDATYTVVYKKTPISYSITYNLNGGTNSANNPISYTVENEVVFENASRKGYTFDGWYLNGTIVKTIPAGSLSENIILEAKWSPVQNVLTVASEDETKGTVSIVSGDGYSGESITVLATPKEGYVFDGWYNETTKVNADEKYTFSMPTNDYTLIAHFKEFDSFTPDLDPATKCNIKIVGDYSNFTALEDEFTKFNKYYPNVNLAYMKLDNYSNAIGSVLESSEKPNIFFSNSSMIEDEKYNNVVSHMEELSNVNLKINLDCIRSGLLNYDTSGNILMVPIFSQTYGVLVNNDLFEKEDLAVPTTWNDLVNVCNSFATKGYVSPMMGYSLKSSLSWMNTIAYPVFLATLKNNPEAIAIANNLDPSAGEYMRNALTITNSLATNGAINGEECDKISDNYSKVILRFFEGDVPMMICTSEIASGTKKREQQSQAFIESPFDYSFVPVPVTQQGGYFVDSPSVQFSINKNCENLAMTNEFMRFLIRNRELNEMAVNRRLVTPTKDMSFDPMYVSLGNVLNDNIILPEALGVNNALAAQIRIAAFKVGRGELTIDEAIGQFGKLQ